MHVEMKHVIDIIFSYIQFVNIQIIGFYPGI